MNFFELFILAVALSMDAFAVAICIGLSMQKVSIKKTLIVGLYFGIFQAVMPLIGYFITALFADKIVVYGYWIAFGLLAIVGGKLIFESFKKEECKNEYTLSIAQMLPLACATSIDALAVGASFAFIQVNVISTVLLIGITTLVISMLGVKIGSIFGSRLKSKAQLVGGIILLLIGLRILLEHYGIIDF
ncbi:MAG: manganese efflux pump MntP family protein [Oscillospiraceae bacterium]|jgi:putative Mn2+ efflux pump MntP|nr:manganese efflux pump MntP family protein [Oscillospiraceae bacterium]